MAEQPQDPNRDPESSHSSGDSPGSDTPGPEAPGTPGAGDVPPGAAAEVPKSVRTMGMLCHLLALCGIIVPFGNILGPLIIWLIKKDEHPFIDDQGKESLNFQITMTIAAIVLGLVTICIVGVGALAVAIFALVMVIIASMKANEGEHYRYPLTLRLIT